MGTPTEAEIMECVRAAFDQSGMTLEQLGKRMGRTGKTARKSAWQFLNRTTNPRLSMLRRFAEAVNVPLSELVDEKPKPKKR